MIYSSFALLVGRWEVWAHFIFVWTVLFTMRMIVKDLSLEKKQGWAEYSRRSWLLLPKIWSSHILSIIVYGLFAAGVYGVISVGGVENLKNLVK